VEENSERQRNVVDRSSNVRERAGLEMQGAGAGDTIENRKNGQRTMPSRHRSSSLDVEGIDDGGRCIGLVVGRTRRCNGSRECRGES
jgi:hypothetical protein